MTLAGAEILTNPDLCAHIVYPYANDDQMVEAVCLFASAGLRKDESVLLVMTDVHQGPVRQRLGDNGFDFAKLESTGQLVCADADQLLASFVFRGIIDEYRFKTTIGDLIVKARVRSATRSVRVFGEMVDLMWASNPKATHRMEELWNEVIAAHSVPLLCAYSLSGERPALSSNILDYHSHAVS